MFSNKNIFDVLIRNIAKKYNSVGKKDIKIKISGEFHGNIFSEGKILVDKSAKVFGDVRCMRLDCFGKILGNVYLESEVNLKAEGVIIGDIECQSINVSSDAIFNGKCTLHDGSLDNKNFNYKSDNNTQNKQEPLISTENILRHSINVDYNKHTETINEGLKSKEQEILLESSEKEEEEVVVVVVGLDVNHENNEEHGNTTQHSVLNDEITKDDYKEKKENKVRRKLF